MLTQFLPLKSFATLCSLPIPKELKLLNRNINGVYNINNTVEHLFYKHLFPDTFSYLNSLSSLDYLLLNKKELNKVKEATEELHRLFIKATEYILPIKNIWKRFNFSEREWNFIRKNFNRTRNDYFYGRMDIGFSLDFSKIKIFEYNTGLCGDIYDSTSFQNKIFNYYCRDKHLINDTFSSGSFLLDSFADRWLNFISKAKNKTVYFICTPSKMEKLILSSFIEALKKKKIKYKICYYAKGIELDKTNNTLYDKETNQKIDVLYKTYAWYKIFRELNKNQESFFQYFLNKNTKIIEPSWKTVMGNKALLPYVYQLNKGHPLLLPSSFDPFDKCFGEDEYIIEKGLKGRASMMTKKVKRSEIIKKKSDVIYQKVFSDNVDETKKYYFIMGSWVVGKQFGGLLVKKSNKMINEYNCNVIPVRIKH